MEHFPKCHITVLPVGIYFSLTKLPAEPDTVRLSFPLQCISIYKQSKKKKNGGVAEKWNGLSRLPLKRDKDRTWQPYISIRSRRRNIEPVRSIGLCAADPSERQITILPPVVNSLPAGLLLHAGIQTSRFIIFIYFIYLFIFGARRQTRLRVDLTCLAAAGGGRGCACLSVRGVIKTLLLHVWIPPSPKPLFVITQSCTFQTNSSFPLIWSPEVATERGARSGAASRTGVDNGKFWILHWLNRRRKRDGRTYTGACVRTPVEVSWYNNFFAVCGFSSGLLASLAVGTGDDVGSSTNVRK